MLTAGHSVNLFFWVMLAFACSLFVLAFIFVEESSYERSKAVSMAVSGAMSGSETKAGESRVETSHANDSGSLGPRKTFLQTLAIGGRYAPNEPFFSTMYRSFTYFLVPQVLWVVTTYGICIGLGSFVMGLTFPIKIVQPPYLWSTEDTGLQALAPMIGFILAVPFSSTSDRLAAYMTKRNKFIREAEFRLGVLLIPMLIAPAGLVLYGFAAEKNLHWIAYFLGSAIMCWGSFFYFSFTIAYAVDSYFANTSEMLIAMNIGKQAISFGFGFEVVDWVLDIGYAKVISGIFSGVLLANNLAVIIFLIWGKRIRVFMATSWLGKYHQETANRVH